MQIRQLFAGCCLILAFSAFADTWRFAVLGDIPYSPRERQEMPAILDAIANDHPSFVVHAGDFKLSNARCSDDLFLDRKRLFDSSRVPFIYTPGDNEWTDCKNLLAGHFKETERLDRLRSIFFSKPQSLGQEKISVEQQSTRTPENLRWRLGPALFISLNVPGPNNNFGTGNQPSTEFSERNPVLVQWLKQGFESARQQRARALVIVMQGDPEFKHFNAGLGDRGYRELLETLLFETRRFPGQVLLIHGDTHWHRIDHPLRDPRTDMPLSNFTRLETFGYPFMGWIKVEIDDTNPAIFRFESIPYKPKNHGLWH